MPRLTPDGACGTREPEGNTNQNMMTRTTTASVAGRSVAMRRLRRRSHTATQPYCSTNGCTSFLVVDPTTEVATCPICGYTRRLR
jgi:hypothetical protein